MFASKQCLGHGVWAVTNWVKLENYDKEHYFVAADLLVCHREFISLLFVIASKIILHPLNKLLINSILYCWLDHIQPPRWIGAHLGAENRPINTCATSCVIKRHAWETHTYLWLNTRPAAFPQVNFDTLQSS